MSAATPAEVVPSRAVAFASGLERHGAAPALRHGGTTLSYADLAARVRTAVESLGPVRRLVLVELANEPEPLVWYLAALAAGHPVVVVPPNGAAHRIAAEYLPDVVVRGGLVTEHAPGTAHELHPDLALLLSTSGATGSPKLVRLSHANVESNATAIGDALGIRATDRAVTSLPLSYCYGLSVLHSHLARGAAVVLTDASVLEPAFWDEFRTAGATTLAGVPHTFELLDRVGFADLDLPSLRLVTQAGGRMSPAVVRRYADLGGRRGWDLVVMYGQTEATARMAYLPPHLARTRPETVGVPIPGGTLRVPEPGPDGVGELVYAGPNVMLGYAHGPADLALGRTVDELRTGDAGRIAPDGLVEVVGRADRTAKVLGLRVDLGQVEARLADAGLTAACLAAGPGVVVVAERSGRTGDPVLLRRAAARAAGLPPVAVRAVVVDALPRRVSGKVDAAEVRRRFGSDTADSGEAAATTPLGRLSTLYADVLGLPPGTAGPDSTFVGLGGDSLTYVALSVRLERLLGVLPAGWHTTPLARLAALVPQGGCPLGAGCRGTACAPAGSCGGTGAPAEAPDATVPAAVGAGRRRAARLAVRRTATVETSVLLRALALVLVVGSHIGVFDLRGGAHLLVGIAGYSFARFHRTDAPRRERLHRQWGSVRRLLAPTLVWFAVLLVALPEEYGPSVLLVNSVVGENAVTPELRYWFVEALLACLLGALVLTAVPATDRWLRRWPFGSALVLLGVGLAIWLPVATQVAYPFSLLSPGAVVWLFALGWAVAVAGTRVRLLALSVPLVLGVPWTYENPTRAAVVVVGMLALAWVPTVRVPAWLAAPTATLAGASLFVYLTHYEVYPLLGERHLLALAASLVVGVLAAEGWDRGRRAVARRRFVLDDRVLGPLRGAVGR